MYEMILSEPLHIQIHILAALLAVAAGPVALYRKRRDMLHKVTGYVWVVAMLVVATSSWFISSFAIIGPFSPVHGFAILTYWSIYVGMRAVFARRIDVHEAVFRSLYWNGLLVAGLANFIPGRRMNTAIFGDAGHLGWGVIAVGGLFLVWRLTRGIRLSRTEVA